MTKAIEELIRVFNFRIDRPFDPRVDASSAVLEQFMSDLFEYCCDAASEKLDRHNFTPGMEAIRCFVVYASEEWHEASEKFNALQIPLIEAAVPSAGKYLRIDERGFIGALLQTPPEELGAFKPILDEYVEEERRLHPEYVTFDRTNKQPEIKLTTREFEEIVPINQLLDRQLLAAYFETYNMLAVYRGMHDYDDPKAKELAVRMELILKRMEEVASGK